MSRSKGRTVALETVKQLPAILASLALVVTAAKGCRQQQTIEVQKQDIQDLEDRGDALAEQVVSVATIRNKEGEGYE